MLLRVVAVSLLALACATPGPYSDPDGVQLPLFGDQRCSDPVFGQMALQCCSEHDNCFAFGARQTPDGRERLSDRASFALCNVEFEACNLAWGVPPWAAKLRREGVDRWGWDHFEKREE